MCEIKTEKKTLKMNYICVRVRLSVIVIVCVCVCELVYMQRSLEIPEIPEIFGICVYNSLAYNCLKPERIVLLEKI